MKYIFEVRIKPGSAVEEYVDAWKKGSSIIQKQSGARGTRLYRKIGEENVLLAIAEWESKDERDKAMKELEKVDMETRATLEKHKEFGEITRIGAFDETEWKVIQ